VRQYYNKITTGLAYPQISLQQVRETKIPLPPLLEQRAIAAALGEMDALIAALDSLIAKKRDIKQAAMQQLLTGKTRLFGFDGASEPLRQGYKQTEIGIIPIPAYQPICPPCRRALFLLCSLCWMRGA
jgi:type I restriction enzyme S subunit